MHSEKKIFSVAFEGMHRSGKGTQIGKMERRLTEAQIPWVSIKGEGYRNALGNTEGDPKSDFWDRITKELDKGANFEVWEEASYRLAREMIVWRKSILSNKIEESLAPFGVMLIDRSLISKANLKSLQEEPAQDKTFSEEELYPSAIQKRKKITVGMILPDLIIHLIAPKETLLARLDANDPEYNFRKKNIEEKYDLFINATKHLPQEIRDRVVQVDSSVNSDDLFEEVTEVLKTRVPELGELLSSKSATHD